MGFYRARLISGFLGLHSNYPNINEFSIDDFGVSPFSI